MTELVSAIYSTTYKTALITGASSGLGRGLALAFGKNRTHVIAAARRKAELDSLVTEIVSAGGSAEAMVLDCSDADAVYETVRALDQRKSIDLVSRMPEPAFPLRRNRSIGVESNKSLISMYKAPWSHCPVRSREW